MNLVRRSHEHRALHGVFRAWPAAGHVAGVVGGLPAGLATDTERAELGRMEYVKTVSSSCWVVRSLRIAMAKTLMTSSACGPMRWAPRIRCVPFSISTLNP